MDGARRSKRRPRVKEAAPSKKRKTKAKRDATPIVSAAARSALVRVLGHERELLCVVARQLSYRDASALSLVDRGARDLLRETPSAWRGFLESRDVDAWGAYGKVDE